MSRRTVSLVVGGGIALVALLAVLTTVPLRSGPAKAVDTAVTAQANESDSVTCAEIEFAATISYTVRSPLLNVWGLRTIDDATIDPAKLSVTSTGACGEPVSGLGGSAVIQTEPCPVDISGLIAEALAEDAWGSACDLRLTYYAGLNDGSGATMTHTYSGPSRLASSGLGRGDWCPDIWTEAQLSTSSGASSYGAQTTSGELCLPVS
jgi:hypothetical protein